MQSVGLVDTEVRIPSRWRIFQFTVLSLKYKVTSVFRLFRTVLSQSLCLKFHVTKISQSANDKSRSRSVISQIQGSQLQLKSTKYSRSASLVLVIGSKSVTQTLLTMRDRDNDVRRHNVLETWLPKVTLLYHIISYRMKPRRFRISTPQLLVLSL